MTFCPRCDKRYDDESGHYVLCSDCYAEGVMPFGDEEGARHWRGAWLLHNGEWTPDEMMEHYDAAYFSGSRGIVMKLSRGAMG